MQNLIWDRSSRFVFTVENCENLQAVCLQNWSKTVTFSKSSALVDNLMSHVLEKFASYNGSFNRFYFEFGLNIKEKNLHWKRLDWIFSEQKCGRMLLVWSILPNVRINFIHSMIFVISDPIQFLNHAYFKNVDATEIQDHLQLIFQKYKYSRTTVDKRLHTVHLCTFN